ncbi:MAG: dihydroorotate dehydrogenase electron transfer subunit [Candidatus Altiarchaeota archaeon]|nr:dihydroorotate dehydrogenase electron transfer subunit [Candidatus Altiarchaeota archaeon]
MGAPDIVRILKVKDETPTVKTFTLDKKMAAKPGQFAMLWIPGVGEKPFSFSSLKDKAEFTIREVGAFTKKMFTLKKGDLIGIRGPFGDGCFRIEGKKVCVAAGGVGIAPLRPIIDELLKGGRELTVIQGASTVDELMWIDELKKKKLDLLIATDDGTCGSRGSVCDVLHNLLDKGEIDQIYTCGPEPMMKVIADLSLEKKIPCQISLDRYMKCGNGICGQCCVDPSGKRVCKEGPVFTAEELKDSEFGRYRRDASGSRCDI